MNKRWLAMASVSLLLACQYKTVSIDPQFVEVTQSVGLQSTATWKYGGPTLADLNNDGRIDLVLGNHHEQPAQFFLAEEHGFIEQAAVMQWDVHGIAAGDFDRDGRVDLAVAMGGGNGTKPQPPRLLRNTDNGFVDVTEEAGIANMGARGRSVRWLDMDLDGDLDLLELNAQQLPGESGPRNILFENKGNGHFIYRSSPLFENVEAERLLITDLNGDSIPDLITFPPLQLLIGKNNFQFSNQTTQWLPDLDTEQRNHAMAAAQADIDGDGDLDLYIARGKTYYEIANNALEFDPLTGRIDLRDEGNKSNDYIRFRAGGNLVLKDFYHWPRGKEVTLPVYLGSQMQVLDTPTTATHVNAQTAKGLPDHFEQDGWHLAWLGDDLWQLSWNLSDNLAWDIRASIEGATAIEPPWQPQVLGMPDLLLRNDGDHFVDISQQLPPLRDGNHWGVITGDFDNNGRTDFFVYRFGKLQQRTPDLMLLNHGQEWDAHLNHGATHLGTQAHGDMGAALDMNNDGKLDILSGDDDQGQWHLFANRTDKIGNYLKINIGRASNGIDAHGAEVWVSSNNQQWYQRVGNTSAVHSQSFNTQLHFGLGQASVTGVRVRWRDGSEQQLKGLWVNQQLSVGVSDNR